MSPQALGDIVGLGIGERSKVLGARQASLLTTAMLLIMLYFLAYRYPFQINNSVTSPTYADTPAWLSAAKYVLLIIVAVVVSARYNTILTRAVPSDIQIGYSIESRNAGTLTMLLLAGGLWIVLKGAILSSTAVVEVGFFWLLTAIWLTRVRTFSRKSVERTLICFAVVAIMVEAAQYSLFLMSGRLPALAYDGTLSIRFGSVWDDPNGYAFVVSLLMPVCWLSVKKALRVPIQFALLVTLLLTQSLTGISCVLFGLAFARIVALSRRSPVGMLVFGFAGLIVAFVAAWFALASPAIQQVLRLKQNSIDAHLDDLSRVDQIGLTELAGLSLRSVSPQESGFIFLITNLGVLGVVFFLSFCIWAVRSALILTSRSPAPLWEGSLAFLVAVIIGNFNLPLIAVFPINGLTMLVGAFCIVAAMRGEPRPDLQARSRAQQRAGVIV